MSTLTRILVMFNLENAYMGQAFLEGLLTYPPLTV